MYYVQEHVKNSVPRILATKASYAAQGEAAAFYLFHCVASLTTLFTPVTVTGEDRRDEQEGPAQ